MTILAHHPAPGRPERLFTVQEYLRMVQTGILGERDKVELLNGRIVEKMARNPPHDSALLRVSAALAKALSEGYLLRSQSALMLRASVPEPDLAVVRGPASRYDAAHPRPEDVLLVIEVSDSTLADDQGEKLALYADAGLACYWIINLVDRRVEVYTDPTGRDSFPDYRNRRDISEDQMLALQLPDSPALQLSVRDLLPGTNRL